MDHHNYFYYPNAQAIDVTNQTMQLTPHTFPRNRRLWEFDAIKKFFSYVKPDDEKLIIDVGAQTGLYSLYAKFLPKCVFVAFEPFKPTCDELVKNLKLNEINNVIVYNVALSNYEGNRKLNTCKSHNGLHTLGEPLRFKDVVEQDCWSSTIDILFEDRDEMGKVDMIKIDTEGHELQVLMGAHGVILRDRPIIQLEYHAKNLQQCETTETQLLDYIRDELNYRIDSIQGEEMIILPN